MRGHRVIVVGGGWAGCSAALSAAAAGAEVRLFEKTDMLLGAGLVGGIMRNNGRYTATEEALRMGGGGELFAITDEVARHVDVEFPGQKHASLYDVIQIEPRVRQHLSDSAVDVQIMRRVVDVRMDGNSVSALVDDEGEIILGDAFVDATGTSGPMGACVRYGNGCVMCIQRCPAFGGRVSVTGRSGVPESMAVKGEDLPGAMSGSGKLNRESLSGQLRRSLEQSGVVVLPLPEELRRPDKLATKPCQQYALPEYADNIVLLDTGHVKLMTPYFPLDKLRTLEGLTNARYEDPYAGGKGNSIRFTAVAPRDRTLRVTGRSNLFCAGEKAGVYVGHTEAIVTGMLAGHNAARYLHESAAVELSADTVCGDLIAWGGEARLTAEGRAQSQTLAGSVLFERLCERDLYTTQGSVIDERIDRTGLRSIFSRSI